MAIGRIPVFFSGEMEGQCSAAKLSVASNDGTTTKQSFQVGRLGSNSEAGKKQRKQAPFVPLFLCCSTPDEIRAGNALSFNVFTLIFVRNALIPGISTHIPDVSTRIPDVSSLTFVVCMHTSDVCKCIPNVYKHRIVVCRRIPVVCMHTFVICKHTFAVCKHTFAVCKCDFISRERKFGAVNQTRKADWKEERNPSPTSEKDYDGNVSERKKSVQCKCT